MKHTVEIYNPVFGWSTQTAPFTTIEDARQYIAEQLDTGHYEGGTLRIVTSPTTQF
jgi:hypothetical protein